jgi:transposase
MQHYVGLDVSLKQTTVCVVDQAGKIRREGMVTSEPKAIADFIAANAPHVVRIGFESGATSTWLWTELKKIGLPVICIDARHAKAALKMQINKSDRNDAVGIARIMQCGWYKEVRVKDLDSHAIRAVLSSRALLVELKRDLENQIRGLLKNLGLVIGRCKLNTFGRGSEGSYDNTMRCEDTPGNQPLDLRCRGNATCREQKSPAASWLRALPPV